MNEYRHVLIVTGKNYRFDVEYCREDIPEGVDEIEYAKTKMRELSESERYRAVLDNL